MNTIKITLHKVVTTQKEVEVIFPCYLRRKSGNAFYMFIDNDKCYEIWTAINSIEGSKKDIQNCIENDCIFCTKQEFDKALEQVSQNINFLYDAIMQTQKWENIKDECDQRADLEDAKTQEQLENYLNK